MIHPVAQEILNLFEINGGSMYGGEAVTQLEHALQCAELARKHNASNELITASLLHDIGHLLHDLPDDASDNGIDDMHELLGERFMAKHFTLAAVEPVKLHVQAKRYLCATEPGYLEALSTPSKISLEFQGGVMNEEEVSLFQKNEFYKEAVNLRRWDDLAKDPNLVSPTIESFLKAIESSIK
jgi:[1-hydroxy-2-(trimethylamino)ethyl]phosphonate dioxygenase